MTVYRLTFQLDSKTSIPSAELRAIYDDLEKYLKTVCVPEGSTPQAKYGVVIPNRGAFPHPMHRHDGSDGCGSCRDHYNDGIS